MDACLSLPMPMSDADSAGPVAASDEHALVRAAAAGDRLAFEQIYRRHVGRVHGALWRLCGMNPARAEELTQDAFVRAWQNLASFRFESAFSTWLHRLAVNLALMDLRSGKREEELTDAMLEAQADFGSAPCAGEAIELERAVARLPPRARAVLVLHDIEGWKHEEISRELQMAVGSSKAQLHRARGLLRDMLGGADVRRSAS